MTASSFHLIGDTINGGLSVKSNFSYVPPPFSVGVNTLATGNTSPALTVPSAIRPRR